MFFTYTNTKISKFTLENCTFITQQEQLNVKQKRRLINRAKIKADLFEQEKDCCRNIKYCHKNIHFGYNLPYFPEDNEHNLVS